VKVLENASKVWSKHKNTIENIRGINKAIGYRSKSSQNVAINKF